MKNLLAELSVVRNHPEIWGLYLKWLGLGVVWFVLLVILAPVWLPLALLIAFQREIEELGEWFMGLGIWPVREKMDRVWERMSARVRENDKR